MPRYTLTPGRRIARDGVPLIDVVRAFDRMLAFNNGYHLTLEDSLAFAYKIVSLLNADAEKGTTP